MHKQLDGYESSVLVEIENAKLEAHIVVPPHAQGLVLFAHGPGSDLRSPRDTYIAKKMNDARLGTVLIDLSTDEERLLDEQTGFHRFDVNSLGSRLTDVIDWLIVNPSTEGLPIGLIGADKGAACAIIAASRRAKWVKAIVSRGGLTDLLFEQIPDVVSPILFLIGAEDSEVLENNRQAYEAFDCVKRVCVIPAATHLFSECGAMDLVAKESVDWFVRHFS